MKACFHSVRVTTQQRFDTLLRLARSGMKASFHSVRVTTQQRLNTAWLCRAMCERSEFRQIPRGNREEPLLLVSFQRKLESRFLHNILGLDPSFRWDDKKY